MKENSQEEQQKQKELNSQLLPKNKKMDSEVLTEKQLKYRNIGKVVYISISFMIYFSAANSGLLTNSEIYDQKDYKNLGNASEIILFVFSAITSVLAPYFISETQYRWRFSVASIAFILFMGCGILVTNCPEKDSHFYCGDDSIFSIVIILSTITGTMNVILFLTQNQYVSELTNDKNKGLFFGMSWALLQFAYCIGNIYSSYIIVPLGQQNYFILMTCICVFGGILFLFVKQPPPKIKTSEQIPLRDSSNFNQDLETIEDQSENTQDQYNPEQEKKKEDSVVEEVEHDHNITFPQYFQQLFQVTKNPIFRRLIPYFLSSGIILSFQFGLFYTVIQHSVDESLSEEEVNQKTFRVLIFLGVGETIGGSIIAKISDKFGNVNAASITNLIFFTAILTTMLAYNLESYTCCFIASFFWGMSDCSTQSINCACISEKFGDDIYVFGLYNFTQCVATCFGMINSVIFKDQDLNYYLVIMVVIQILVNFSLNFIPKKKIPIQYKQFNNSKLKEKKEQK